MKSYTIDGETVYPIGEVPLSWDGRVETLDQALTRCGGFDGFLAWCGETTTDAISAFDIPDSRWIMLVAASGDFERALEYMKDVISDYGADAFTSNACN